MRTHRQSLVLLLIVAGTSLGSSVARCTGVYAQSAADAEWRAIVEQRAEWWSLQPLANVAPPLLDNDTWSVQPLDRFILRSLREHALQPAADADPQVLARRLAIVLTGLPPAPQQVRSLQAHWARDPQAALETLVDELLASPHYGERMARHWMDVVRYTDTYGYEWDNPARGSWEYRDYLIRAFNQDIGFDQLVREQIAGDLLDEPRIGAASGLHESLIGPMFYHMGEHRHGDSLEFNGIHQEMIDNKIDAFSKAFLASTVACARCHDHKLDPFSQRDYYALAAVFMTPRWTARVIEAPGSQQEAIRDLQRLRRQIQKRLEQTWRAEAAELPAQLLQAVLEVDQSQRSSLWRSALGLATDQAPSAQSQSADKAGEAPPLEAIGYPLQRLLSIARDDEVAAAWAELVAEWQAASRQRREQNEAQYEVLADFRDATLPAAWTAEGDGMRYGYVDDGTALVALEGDAVVQRLLPRGYHTHALSSKLPGALRMPAQQRMPGSRVSVQLAGGEWSGFLRVPDNAFQTESVTFFGNHELNWQSFADMPLKDGVQRVTHEIVTCDLNPNFPPRTGKATVAGTTLPANDSGFHKRSWFSVTRIVAHDAAGAPADELERFGPLYREPYPTTRKEAWQRAGDWLAESVVAWCERRADGEQVKLVNWLLEHRLLSNRSEMDPEVAQLVEKYRSVERSMAFPRTALSMDERNMRPFEYPLNVRGDVNEPGPLIERDFLGVFSGRHDVGESGGSGRRELADYLVSPENPLTARVYVNRVWQWVFGEALVRTPNDFGHLGELPTHPDLLDYLAQQFMADGWSTKRLIRRLVLSRTFRQSGAVSERAAAVDPDNRLLHHHATRRMDAESIRDSILAVAGNLDEQLYGPPIDPPRLKEDPAKRLFSGPLDGNGRRSMYIRMSIMDPPKLLVGFNLPDLKLPTGKRDATNVPAQALILLNDPLVQQQAERWSQQLVTERQGTIEQRVGDMFLQAYGREARDDERRRWSEFVRELAGNRDDDTVLADSEAWQHAAHTLFNTKEFLYYR